jgi:two-component system, response regulator YesN
MKMQGENKMYNILIVDDEYLIRVAISSKIKFCEFPYENIYFADNGYDALVIVETNPVDIMMIDIRMPGMDGLALIRKVKDLRKHIHFIVISGYADFDYARDALQSGVDAYLLKPIDDDQFVDALNRLREKIDLQFKKLLQTNEMELNSQALAIEREMNLLFHALPKKVLQHDGEGLDAMTQYRTGFFQLMMIRMENRPADDENEFILIKKQIVRLIGEKVSSSEDCVVINDFLRLNTTLVIFHDSVQEHMTSTMKDVLRALIELIHDVKGITIGTSAMHDSLGKLLYSESLWACDLRLLYKDRDCFAYRTDFVVKALPKDYYDDFKDLLETKELQLFEARIREVLDPGRIIATMHGNIREVVGVLLSLISQKNDVNDSIHRPSVDECIENARNIEDIITFIYNYSENIFFKDLVVSTNCRNIIEKVEKYILIHYKKKLVLRELAVMYNMNSNYMSSIFKKILGKGFSDYLTQVRLNHACDMLLNTKMSINEIAQESGFENSSYFYRVFKNAFGITALKYRNHATYLGSE